MPSYPGGVGLVIGVPWDGKPTTVEWAFALMNLNAPTNYDIRWAMIKGRPVDEARTLIAESAIKEKAKYLFFLGTDVTVPPFAVRQLIFHLEHHPKYAVAGAIYVHKSQPQEPLVYRGNGMGPYWDWKIGEVFDVSGIGMDATLIRVEALKNMPKPWFKTVHDLTPYFDGISKGEHWTEDLFFAKQVARCCYKCNQMDDNHKDQDHEFAGWGLLADGGLLCKHWDNQNGIAYELPMNSKPYSHIFTKGPKKVVDLGCGDLDSTYRTNEGETLRVDIRESVNPDYRCDLRHLPFANEFFDVVFSSHVLEHFARTEVFKVADEMTRICKKDGEIRLVLPNLEWAAKHIMNKEIDTHVMNVLYGAQTYDENFHKIGFTPTMVEQIFAERGWKKFQWDFDSYHMIVRMLRSTDQEFSIMNPQVVGVVEPEPAKMEVALKPTTAETVADFSADKSNGSVMILKQLTAPKKETKAKRKYTRKQPSVKKLVMPLTPIN